jgi:hypothetical protein
MGKHGPSPPKWRRIVAGAVLAAATAAALFGAGIVVGHASSPGPQVTASAPAPAGCHVAVSGHVYALKYGAVLSQPGTQITCDRGAVSVQSAPAAPAHVTLPPWAGHLHHVWHVMHMAHLAHLAYLMRLRL